VLVVDDVDVDVELVDVVGLAVDELDDEELDDEEVEVDVVGPSEDELLDEVDVVVLVVTMVLLVVTIVVGGCAVLEVVGFGADDPVVDVDDGVAVVDVTVPASIVLDVLVDVDTSCAGRVVLVVVEARGTLVDVDVVLVTTA